MFDWPAQYHTSPTSTFFSVIELLPVMVISCGPPGCMGESFTIQRPSAPALP